jgi:hypothetical protein
MLTPVAWVVLLSAGICASAIVVDIVLLGRRQPMPIMEIVWPVTALYLGPLALLGYWRWGRSAIRGGRPERDALPDRPYPVIVGLAVAHCGAGCTIGDIMGSTLVFALALEVAGLALWAELPINFVLAFTLGIVFQYLTIAPMRGLGLRDGLVAAVKADTLSLTAFEVGLFGWMILVQLFLFAPGGVHADDPVFWFMMQVGMALGFLTAYPVNWWLVRIGLKERM